MKTPIRIWMLTALLAADVAASALTIEQIVSREHDGLKSENSAGRYMAIGRDGRVYLAGNGYVVRLHRDGSNKVGLTVSVSIKGVAANADGVIAVANAHVYHSVNLWSPTFQPAGKASDFLNSDDVGWGAPSDVAAGESGDFYAGDLNRNRIVRITPWGNVTAAFPLDGVGESFAHAALRLRVNEKLERFYLVGQQGEDLHGGKRPGKRAWSHPEIFNDDGTGGMMFPMLLQAVMRGVDGTGWAGKLPGWRRLKESHAGAAGRFDNDPRLAVLGGGSAARALNTLLRQYGPWLTTLEAADQVAIVVSTRMMRMEEFENSIGGFYFTRLYEASNSRLCAHRPASFVFTEDLTPGALRRFKAVLVVGQRVELDPPLAQALAAAKAAGVSIFYDGTCREELVRQFTPLGVAFDEVVNDPDFWQDDAAYYRFPRYFMRHAKGFAATLGAVVPPVAGVPNPEVLLTERRNGEGRFVWAVNNDLFDCEPGVMWRIAMFIGHRVPQAVPIDLNARGMTVYEVFVMRPMAQPVADLRTVPARLFAILPGPIRSLAISVPDKLNAGDAFRWSASVDGPKTSYPLHVRLLDAGGSVIESIRPTRLNGEMVMPLNAGASVTFEATELISGKTAKKTIQVAGVPSRSGAIAQKADPLSDWERWSARPAEEFFGPHLRDVAVSADGSSALINAMNWDDNVYVLDAATGRVRQQGSVGHFYAYGPVAAGSGFFAQGFDCTTAEGHHLYDLGRDGKPRGRFALFGVPNRGTKTWTASRFDERVNFFAVAPNGSWIASAGNLGLIVWSSDGRKLWTQEWCQTSRKTMILLAQNDDTLVTLDGMTASAYRAATGQQLWQIKFSDGVDWLEGGSASADGKTLAIFSDSEGGRAFIVRGGKLINTLAVLADDHCLTPDGRFLAVVTGNELRWCACEPGGGLLWCFTGDDSMQAPSIPLHEPRISPDGSKIALGSTMGTLWVLDDGGRKLVERDLDALPTAAWLPNGDLLAATWSGNVLRLDANGAEKWRVKLQPKGPARPGAIPAPDATLTFRASWGNASEKPEPLTPNLLSQTRATIHIISEQGQHIGLQNPVELLTDGKPQPPEQPWMKWSSAGGAGSGWTGKFTMVIESGRVQMRVAAITFVEDPAHPESWLRDVLLQYWDPVKATWINGPYLLSDSPVHTHRLEKPIDSNRFRLIGAKTWLFGNVRLGEVAFHGELLGGLHPDSIADRPVAVLFDEDDAPLKTMQGISFIREGAFSGDLCAGVNPGISGPGELPRIGHAIPGWDFEIVEKPQRPGQYRWLQFAWKPLSPDTKAMAVLIGWQWASGLFAAVAGAPDYDGLPDGRPGGGSLLVAQKVADAPPADWQVVRVDLWKLKSAGENIKPGNIRCLGLVASGGGMAVDSILLGKNEADLPPIGEAELKMKNEK